MQEFQLFGRQCAYQSAHAGEITARPVQTIDKAQLKWVGASQEYNGDRFVAAFAANADGTSNAKITDTFRSTSSPTSDDKRLY